MNESLKKLLSFLALFLLSFPALEGKEPETVRLAIASNLIPVMKEITSTFEKKNPGARVEIISGSSGKLATQIINGAPYDLFASADTDFPEKIRIAGLSESGPEVYATGGLVLFSASGVDLSRGIRSVDSAFVKKIAIANPETAPYGKASIQSMKKAGVYEAVRSRFVIAENITQAAQFASRGTDCGFIAQSVMYEPSMKKFIRGKNWIPVPDDLHDPLLQGVVLLKNAKDKNHAMLLYRYILSPEAKKMFTRYGYK